MVFDNSHIQTGIQGIQNSNLLRTEFLSVCRHRHTHTHLAGGLSNLPYPRSLSPSIFRVVIFNEEAWDFTQHTLCCDSQVYRRGKPAGSGWKFTWLLTTESPHALMLRLLWSGAENRLTVRFDISCRVEVFKLWLGKKKKTSCSATAV